jgi:dethiobiotin synthetase
VAPLTVVISGTDTEVGKTWLGARLIESLRASGIEVHARKPVQSFDRRDELTDAEILSKATGETAEEVTPEHRWYPLAMAPPMAAEALNRPEITMQDLAGEARMPESGVVIVEGVGGPRSPLAHNGDTVSLARALEADLAVIVAPAGLGVVNSVMLSTSAFAPLRTIVFLNRFDPLDEIQVRSRDWLVKHHNRSVLTTVEEISSVISRMQAERAGQLG